MAPIDDTELCVSCTENLNALIDDRDESDWEADKREMAEELAREPWESQQRKADNESFGYAAGQMTREDWDADNDWLASAGWGEM